MFLPGESHGQRSLAGHSLWGGKELDTSEALTLSCCFEVVPARGQLLVNSQNERVEAFLGPIPSSSLWAQGEC